MVKRTKGSVQLVLVILLVEAAIVFLSFYIYMLKTNGGMFTKRTADNVSSTSLPTQSPEPRIEQTEYSSDVNSIEEELNGTDLDSVDGDLNDLDSSINSI